jgi:hypothetical protein
MEPKYVRFDSQSAAAPADPLAVANLLALAARPLEATPVIGVALVAGLT